MDGHADRHGLVGKNDVNGRHVPADPFNRESEDSVEPVYEKAHFSTEGDFTAKISFGYVIYAGIRLMVQMKKSKGLPKGVYWMAASIASRLIT